MVPAQFPKFGLSVVPQSINDTDTNGTGVDCAGFHTALAVCHFGAVGAADVTEIEIQESDDNSSWSDVSGTSIATIVQGDVDNSFFAGSIDLRKRKRYLRWHINPGAAATLVTGFFMLYRGDESPNTDAERGLYTTQAGSFVV